MCILKPLASSTDQTRMCIKFSKWHRRSFERSAREIALCKFMSHDNIIKVHESFITSVNIGLMQKYYHCDGSEIRFSCGEGLLYHMFFELIPALNYIHSFFIAHMDIKPRNLLVSLDKHLVLSDFNMATFFGHDLCKPIGTKGYVARELQNIKHRGEVYAHAALDYWSFGETLLRFMKKTLSITIRNKTLLIQFIHTMKDVVPEQRTIPTIDLIGRESLYNQLIKSYRTLIVFAEETEIVNPIRDRPARFLTPK